MRALRLLALASALAAASSCAFLDVLLDPTKRGCWSTFPPSTKPPPTLSESREPG